MAGNETSQLFGAYLNCFTGGHTATFKIREFMEKKSRFLNFLEKLGDLATCNLNSPVAPNCENYEAQPGHTQSKSAQSPP